jgi:hypothetical protein
MLEQLGDELLAAASKVSSNGAEALQPLVGMLRSIHADLVGELNAGLGARRRRGVTSLARVAGRLRSLLRALASDRRATVEERKSLASASLVYAIALARYDPPVLWVGYTGAGYAYLGLCRSLPPVPILPHHLASLVAPTTLPQLTTTDAGCSWRGGSREVTTRTCVAGERAIDDTYVEEMLECGGSDHVAYTITASLGGHYTGLVAVLGTDGARLDRLMGRSEAETIIRGAAEAAGTLAYNLHRSLSCLHGLGYSEYSAAYLLALAGCLAGQSREPRQELEALLQVLLEHTQSGDDRSVAMLVVQRAR